MARILLSAYACEPNKGSEPEVGWQWALNIAKYHEVWVLTKENNQNTIECFFKQNPDIQINNLHFVYIGLPKWLTFWKQGNRGMRPYYYLWQQKALQVAKRLHQKYSFDLVHSVTFVSLTQPCFMYKLGIPFIWTVAGGENIPTVIKYKMELNEKVYEWIRYCSQIKTKHSIRINRALNCASMVLATTEDTMKLIPERYRNKTYITSAIGIEKRQVQKHYHNQKNDVRVLLSGKFTYLKGVRIGIDAILEVIDKYPNVKFNILGNGPYKKEYEEKCKKYIGKQIFFIDKIQHEQMFEFYRKHNFLINTALRDSGCLVAMEAMSVGIPIVCIDTGGVKEMTEKEFAFKVEPCCYNELVKKMAEGISYYIENPESCIQQGKQAYEHINQKYLYELKVKYLMEHYNRIIGAKE